MIDLKNDNTAKEQYKLNRSKSRKEKRETRIKLLEEMLSQVKEENKHPAIERGYPVGNELW
jgi:hypothetical protein